MIAWLRAWMWTRRNHFPFKLNLDYARSTLKHVNIWRRPPTVLEWSAVTAIVMLLLVLLVVMAIVAIDIVHVLKGGIQ